MRALLIFFDVPAKLPGLVKTDPQVSAIAFPVGDFPENRNVDAVVILLGFHIAGNRKGSAAPVPFAFPRFNSGLELLNNTGRYTLYYLLVVHGCPSGVDDTSGLAGRGVCRPPLSARPQRVNKNLEWCEWLTPCLQVAQGCRRLGCSKTPHAATLGEILLLG